MANNPKVTANLLKEIGLSLGEMQTFDKLAHNRKGKSIVQIAKDLGIHRKTVYDRLRRIGESDYIKRQVARLETLEDLNYANALSNILSGNWETTKDIWKGTGVLREKITVGLEEDKLSDEDLKKRILGLLLKKAEVVEIENKEGTETKGRLVDS
jgi:DNA-binding Lrp family transcriptional regulator